MPSHGLNEAQALALTHIDGPVLIMAGAGAGKTRTIAARVAHMIEVHQVRPSAIVAITFTNKAAGEMRERILGPLKEAGGGLPFIGTFHRLGATILRTHGSKLGLPAHFSILDKDDGIRIMKSALNELGLTSPSLNPRRLLGAISKAKNKGQSLNHYRAEAGRSYWTDTVAASWAVYERQLRAQSALDFDDLLGQTVRLLVEQPAVLAHYRETWQYFHIDEYQDTNDIQYHLATLLAGPRRNLCVVGDVDQAIYGWRGADFRHLLRFTKDFPDAKVILLEENYRSTQTILAAANDVITKNAERWPKQLFTKNGAGEPIHSICTADELEEAARVAAQTRKLITTGMNPSEIAVLYRVNFQSRVLEEAFLRNGLPYQVLGTKFYERQEVKDVLAYIKAALNPGDVECLKRIANVPPRGIGKVSFAQAASGQASELKGKARAGWQDLTNILADIKKESEKLTAAQLIKYAIERSGIGASFKQSGTEDDWERLGNLEELVNVAGKYNEMGPAGIAELLNEAALVSDQDTLDERQPAVRLMTVHAAKGLEFKTVFIVGLEQELFPLVRGGPTDGEEENTSAAQLEEERRLFYVALTRAKERVYLSQAASRMLFGRRRETFPSEFIGEISPELIEPLF